MVFYVGQPREGFEWELTKLFTWLLHASGLRGYFTYVFTCMLYACGVEHVLGLPQIPARLLCKKPACDSSS